MFPIYVQVSFVFVSILVDNKEFCIVLRFFTVEVIKLSALVVDLQCRSPNTCGTLKTAIDPNEETLVETRAALDAERSGTARLEQALAASVADNAALAALLHATDNDTTPLRASPHPPPDLSTNITPIDSFLAE